MMRTRSVLSAVLATVVGASGIALPAALAYGGDGGNGPRGHSGDGPRGGQDRHGVVLTLTEESTGTLDAADADLDAIDGAWTRRDSAGRIVLSLGRPGSSGPARGTAGGSRGGFTLATDATSTTWSDVRLDKRSGTVTADVDGADDLVVLTFESEPVRGHHRGGGGHGSTGGSRTIALALTAAAADDLDGVVGADEFDEGDLFGTLGGARR